MARVTVINRPEGHAAVFHRVVKVGEAVAEAVADDARDMAPIDTGELVESIGVAHVRVLTWHVTVGTDHWKFMEYGTLGRNPVIVPRIKKALWWPGLSRPVPRVNNHPGNPAQPFMRPATYQRRGIWITPTGRVVVTT